MSQIQHNSIGKNAQHIEVEHEEITQRRKELIERYNKTPWRSYALDQLSVWVVWASLASALFLYSTVSAVVMAVR